MSALGHAKSLGSTTSIIRSAFMKICSDKIVQRRLWNKWLPAENWVEAIRKSNLVDQTFMSSINVASFNSSMGKCKGDFDGQMMSRFDGTNSTGIFRLRFRQAFYYIVTDKNNQVPYPTPLDMRWKEEVMGNAKNVFNLPTTRSSASNDLLLGQPSTGTPANKRQKTSNFEAASSVATPQMPLSPLQELPPPPVAAVNASLDASTHVVTMSNIDTITTNSSRQEQLSSLPSYWNSRDASNLFGVHLHSPLDDVQDKLKLRVELLESVNRTANGWRNAVEGRDPDNLCSPSEIFAVRGRSMMLCLAYQLAILNMNTWTWMECCNEACLRLNPLGIQQATNKRTICDWNKIFRRNNTFPHPNHAVRCGKQPLPLLFEKYPVAMDEIIQFGVKNLTTLSLESVHGFCHDILIPKLFEQWQSENRDQDRLTKDMFLAEHRLSTLSIPTCWRWLHRLGFTYNTKQKGYYVDGHERSDVIASRKVFCETYLTDIEPKCLRWIHVSQHELETTHSVLNPEFGYRFVDADGKSQIEFHVDYCTSCDSEDKALLVGKNPMISIRAPLGSTPIEIFGQDESVFSQFIFPTKSWIGPNQERGLFPKSLGEGLMISAFVSRDSGFRMPVSPQQLEEINALRQGTEYIDKVAATQIYSSVMKHPLKESPFIRSLLIGATKGGYWNSFHMALQLEDAVDCLKVLRPGYDFVFLFDHSQGHARKKEGALDVSNMSRSFGGVKPKIRSSEIVEGCLGPFNCILNIGDVQSMVFEENDDGPWWITSHEGREARRHDIVHAPIDGETPKLANRTKIQLTNALRDEAGITVDPLRPLNEIKEFANLHGIDLQYHKPTITEGWHGKPKGLLQILWERGWIDPCKCTTFKQDKTAGKIVNTSFYTMNGRKDSQTGQLLESSSLQALMGQCTDFKEEETALQFLGKQLGLRVLFTPKFHCEFAGEGIEYNWAHAKAKMRVTPLREKKGRANFIALVMKCICPETVLTKERIRKFAARARAYICTYYHLSKDQEAINDNPITGGPTAIVDVAAKQQLLYKEIERLMKKFKSHRCALDFAHGFVKGELIDLT